MTPGLEGVGVVIEGSLEENQGSTVFVQELHVNPRLGHRQMHSVLSDLFLSFQTQLSHHFPFGSPFHVAPELTMPPYNVAPNLLAPYMGVD